MIFELRIYSRGTLFLLKWFLDFEELVLGNWFWLS